MREIKPAWIAVGVLLVVALFFLLGRASEELAPQPRAVWVAIEPEGTSTAVAGPVKIRAGTPFRLHAVVEAETFGGDTVYYTEAKRLWIAGGEAPAEAVRRWDRPYETRVLWFAVEGAPQYREVTPDAGLEPPRFQESFRADWGQAWTVVGDLSPTVPNFLPDEEQPRVGERFGTQRFHVRVDLFGAKSEIQPEARLRSWGAEELPARVDAFPAVTAALPGALAVPSRVFGLAQIELADRETAGGVEERLAEWTRQAVAFSRLPLLAWWLEERGTTWEALEWRSVELGDADLTAAPGDVLRAGNRVVWVLEDRGTLGRLDYQDLCLDFDRGARVSRLGNIFTGEGLVDRARAPEGDA